MAKAIIEFDLNDPDDKMAHLRAIKSLDLSLAVWELIYNTKKQLEWKIENGNVDKYEVLEMVFEKIHEVIDDHNIIIDELIN